MPKKILTLAVATLIFGAFEATRAQEEMHQAVDAVRASAAPTIDGRVDQEEWKGAATVDRFMQVFPQDNMPASEKTLVHILYDSENLYIGVQCFDSEPGAIKATQMQKEGGIASDDIFEIALSPFGDNRNGYYFAISAGGGKLDGLVDSSKNELNTDWDGVWIGKAQVNEQGWSAEFAIPFRAISFRGGEAWGLNFQRVVRRKQETIRWSALTRSQQFYDFVHAGRLNGLSGIRPGMGLKLRPYASAALSVEDGRMAFVPGGDLSYKLTPATTAQITVNTDFAEAEVDQQQINLTPYPLFFPEKRTFFLQDISVFSFGGIAQSPLPFYSRRIGVANGAKKDIFAGIKVTGREGFANFGMLDVQMYDDPDLGLKNLFVARGLANILSQSSAGFILTHGDPRTTGDNTLIGGDFNYRNSHVFGDRVFTANVWAMGSFSKEGPANPNVSSSQNADDAAFGARISYPNDDLSLTMFAGRYGKTFYPALGFIQRPGTYELVGSARYRWRMNGFVKRLDVLGSTSTFLNHDGTLQGTNSNLPYVELEDRYGDVLGLGHNLRGDVFNSAFDIFDNVTVQPGAYFNNVGSIFLVGNSNRLISPYFGFDGGSFYSGTFLGTAAEITIRPSKYMLFAAGYEHIDVRLKEGHFIVRIIYGKANFIFSPTLSWNTWFQYNNISKTGNVFSRIRYEVSPGQEIFFVLNENLFLEDNFVLTGSSGGLSFKVALNLTF